MSTTKPQSIVHQVLRLEQSLANGMKKMSSWGAMNSPISANSFSPRNFLWQRTLKAKGNRSTKKNTMNKEGPDIIGHVNATCPELNHGEVEPDLTTVLYSIGTDDDRPLATVTSTSTSSLPVTVLAPQHQREDNESSATANKDTQGLATSLVPPSLEPPLSSATQPDFEDTTDDDPLVRSSTYPSTVSLSGMVSVLTDEDGDTMEDKFEIEDNSTTNDHEGYKTVTMEELEDELCFCSGDCYVHIFAVEDEISRAIDKQMQMLASNLESESKFLRLCGTDAYETIIGEKMSSANGQLPPTVVALKRG